MSASDAIPRTIAIVGASLAGATAADTLRRQGYDGRLILVGAERELPYERPPLSKAVLAGTEDESRVFLRSAEWYDEQRIELRLGVRAVALDAAERVVLLDDAGRLPYDRLLIATGSLPIIIPVPGHTRGSIALLYREKFLFTGDHLWWDEDDERLDMGRGVCWYDWPTQLRSLQALRDHRFEWVLPGHGRRWRAPSADAMRAALDETIARLVNKRAR